MALRTVIALCCPLLAACQGAGIGGPDGSPDASRPPDGAPDALPADARPEGDAAPDPCQGLPEEGACEGERLVVCDGAGQRLETDCAAAGQTCLHGDGLGPRCGPEPGRCEDLTARDLCAGDRLYLCHGDRLRFVPCDALGGRCGTDGQRAGCLPGPGGSALAEGQVTRDHREATPDGLGAVGEAPAAGLTVVLLGAVDREPLGLGQTDAQGRFRVSFDPSAATGGVIVRLVALAADPGHRLWVTDGQDATYAVESAPLPDATALGEIALHVSEAQGAGAFHVFETLRGLQDAAAGQGAAALPFLQALWERGETLYCGTCFSRFPPSIFVLGEASDTDEFDRDVLGHEFGHYLAWAVSRDDSPGGPHDGTPTDPRQAWSEGLATWLGLQLLGRSLYVDTVATGATVRDPEDLGADADPLGPLDQLVSEFLVLEVLWDLTDPASGPLDPVARPPAEVLAVLTGYLPSPGLLDRGVAGVDLVDFLDGWMCTGPGDGAGLAAMVVDGQGFPYDFAGPAAPCPKTGVPLGVSLALEGAPGKGGLRARVRLACHRAPGPVTAVLRYPVRGGVVEERLPLGVCQGPVPLEATFALPAGLDPPWVAAGAGASESMVGGVHRSVVVPRRSRPAPSAIRRIPLGGLLVLRLP